MTFQMPPEPDEVSLPATASVETADQAHLGGAGLARVSVWPAGAIPQRLRVALSGLQAALPLVVCLAAHPELPARLRDVAALPGAAEQPQPFPNHLLGVILRWHWHPPIGGVCKQHSTEGVSAFPIPVPSGTMALPLLPTCNP